MKNNIQRACLDNFVLYDYSWIWDEWNFYYYFNDVIDYLNNNEEIVDSVVRDYDIICSLGKSGLVFASYIACKHKKPLVIFSIGEFIDDGSYVLGFGPNEMELIKGKRILIVDSHARSGNTIKSINNFFLKKSQIGWFVIIDCRSDLVLSGMLDMPVKSIAKLTDEIREIFVSIIGSDSLLMDEDFWMKKEKYWLGRDKLDIQIERINKKNVKELGKNIRPLPVRMKKNANGDFFYPLSIYSDHNEASRIACAFYDNLVSVKGGNKRILIIPLTLGAVPISSFIAIKHYQEGADVRLLFPLYRSDKYYKGLLSSLVGYTVVLVDDVITTGGLLYAFYSKYLQKADNIISILSLYKTDLKDREGVYNKYYYKTLQHIEEKGGFIMIGNPKEN